MTVLSGNIEERTDAKRKQCGLTTGGFFDGSFFLAAAARCHEAGRQRPASPDAGRLPHADRGGAGAEECERERRRGGKPPHAARRA